MPYPFTPVHNLLGIIILQNTARKRMIIRYNTPPAIKPIAGVCFPQANQALLVVLSNILLTHMGIFDILLMAIDLQ
jgi:hypothetical protein